MPGIPRPTPSSSHYLRNAHWDLDHRLCVARGDRHAILTSALAELQLDDPVQTGCVHIIGCPIPCDLKRQGGVWRFAGGGDG